MSPIQQSFHSFSYKYYCVQYWKQRSTPRAFGKRQVCWLLWFFGTDATVSEVAILFVQNYYSLSNRLPVRMLIVAASFQRDKKVLVKSGRAKTRPDRPLATAMYTTWEPLSWMYIVT